MANNTNNIPSGEMSKENLRFYDYLVRSWVAAQMSRTIKTLSTIFRAKGHMDTYDDLSTIEGAEVGDLWTVGTTNEMFYLSASGTWESLGHPNIRLDNTVDIFSLYKGGTADNPGNGTWLNPAEDSILAPIFEKVNAIKAVNFEIKGTDWTSSDKVAYPYQAIISNPNLVDGDKVIVEFDIDSTSTAIEAETLEKGAVTNGGIKIYSKRAPSGTISGFYIPFKG